MKVNKQNLGKVSITVEQDYWSEDKSYPKLTIVEVNNVACYLSRKFVPAGIEYSNREYWIRFSSNHIANIVDSLGISKRDGISQRVLTEEFAKINLELSEFRQFLSNIEDVELVAEVKKYDETDLVTDYNYNLTQAYASENPSVYTDWSCLVVDVFANEVITLTSKGGNTARRWALTDNNRVIYDRAEGNTDPDFNQIHYNEHIIPTKNGKLYVNCKSDAASEFSLTISNNVLFRLINEVFEVNKSLLADMEQVKQGKFFSHEYNWEDLQYTDVEPTPNNPEGKGGLYWSFLGTNDNPSQGYVDYHDLDEHAYYAPEYPSVYGSTKFGCLRIQVYAGEIYIISTTGGNRARAYAVTDMSRRIKRISPSCNEDVDENTWNTVLNPVTITIEEDGYLYVDFDNSHGTTLADFYIKKYINQVVDIESLKEKVNNIQSAETSKYKNNPFPINNSTLKVLAIGNSYTDDPHEYLDDIIQASDIDANNIRVCRMARSSARLSYWLSVFESSLPIPHLKDENDPNDETRGFATTCGSLSMDLIPTYESPATMKQILAQDWDIVVFQQFSGDAIDYTTIEKDLAKFVRYIRETVTNQKVCIAWQSVWSYKSYHNNTQMNSLERWQAICKATKNVIAKNGIDIIIPTGTAIQNARNTSLNTIDEITRDGTHLDLGIGRYIAACTWFQTLIAPVFNKTLIGNSFIPNNGQGTLVTNDNKELCQKCAIAANVNRWEITEDLDPDQGDQEDSEPEEDDDEI